MFSLFKGKKKDKSGKDEKAIQYAKEQLELITNGQNQQEQLIFENSSEQIIDYFYKDDIQKAFALINDIQTAYIRGNLSFSTPDLNEQQILSNQELTEEEQKQSLKGLGKRQRQRIEDFLKKPEVKRIEKDVKILNEFMKEMQNLDKWNKFIDKPEQKIYYKKEEGMSVVTCFIEGVVNAPMLNVVAFMAEVEMYKDWLPITPISEILKEITPFRKVVYLRNQLQWPLWPREIFVEGAGYVIKEQKALGLSMESVRENVWFGQELNRNSNEIVETHINKGFTFCQYINDNQCLVRFYINIDIHLEQMPQMMMNWGMKNISGVVFDYVKQNAENFPDSYKRKMEENPQFYEYLKAKIEEAIKD